MQELTSISEMIRMPSRILFEEITKKKALESKPPKKSKPMPCVCDAYDFPHRVGSGSCDCNEWDMITGDEGDFSVEADVNEHQNFLESQRG